jgi:hypothetical protein
MKRKAEKRAKKGFLSSVFGPDGFFDRLFDGIFKGMKTYAGVAVEVTQKLKEIIESGLPQVITALTPGTADDELVRKVALLAPQVMEKILIGEGLIVGAESPSDAFYKITNHIRSLIPSARVKFWMLFSGELTAALSDGKLTLAEATGLAQLVYAEQQAKKADADTSDAVQ